MTDEQVGARGARAVSVNALAGPPARAASRTRRAPARPHARTHTFARGGAGAKAQRLGQKLDRVLVLPAAARRLRRTRPPGVGSMRLGLAHGVSRALAPHPEAAGSGQP